VPGYVPIVLDGNDPGTCRDGYVKRLLRDLDDPHKVVFEKFSKFVFLKVRELFPDKMEFLTFDEWIDSENYTLDHKEEFRVCYRELHGGRPTLSNWTRVLSFVKSESYPTFKHARLINSRHDMFKVWSGPLFKSMEHMVYRNAHFIKNVPVNERFAKILELKKDGKMYFETDFTAFESHFTTLLLANCECQLYSWLLRERPEDAKFLVDVLVGKNRMSLRNGVRCTVFGRRMSGDMCTSLGNGFTNLMLAMFIAEELHDSEFDGYVEGDDGLFALDFVLDPEEYRRLGFKIGVSRVSTPSEAHFCGMIFADSGQIIKDPRKFMQTFAWTFNFLFAGPKVKWELLKAKAMSAICEVPQCPIVGALARHALKMCGDIQPRFVLDWYHKPIDPAHFVNPAFEPSPDTRDLFARKYGISPSLQLEIEAAIASGDMDKVSDLMPPTEESAWFEARFVETI